MQLNQEQAHNKSTIMIKIIFSIILTLLFSIPAAYAHRAIALFLILQDIPIPEDLY